MKLENIVINFFKLGWITAQALTLRKIEAESGVRKEKYYSYIEEAIAQTQKILEQSARFTAQSTLAAKVACLLNNEMKGPISIFRDVYSLCGADARSGDFENLRIGIGKNRYKNWFEIGITAYVVYDQKSVRKTDETADTGKNSKNEKQCPFEESEFYRLFTVSIQAEPVRCGAGKDIDSENETVGEKAARDNAARTELHTELAADPERSYDIIMAWLRDKNNSIWAPASKGQKPMFNGRMLTHAEYDTLIFIYNNGRSKSIWYTRLGCTKKNCLVRLRKYPETKDYVSPADRKGVRWIKGCCPPPKENLAV